MVVVGERDFGSGGEFGCGRQVRVAYLIAALVRF
jgi:hypothetical protein